MGGMGGNISGRLRRLAFTHIDPARSEASRRQTMYDDSLPVVLYHAFLIRVHQDPHECMYGRGSAELPIPQKIGRSAETRP